ncbi:MAG: ATP-binding domain-containing protein [Solirubrobacteraceae bacterium]
MTEADHALREEQEHLDATIEAFDRALAELSARRPSSGIDEFANDALDQLRRERLRAYTAASGPLYFGRIDRVSAGPTYVGRHLVVDRRSRLLAINWRAPAAEPFYAATPRDPRGITLRRRLDIEDGRLLGFVDEGFASPGEDHLTEAIIEDITRRRVGEMRQIIATITPEQYDVITEEPVPALVIQGGPGTGKTAVGLHRAAWLLYAEPALRNAGVLVVGPNRTFIAYIGQVLPALGERAVEQRDIDALVARRDQHVDESAPVATLKGSGRMALVLHRLLWSRLRAPEQESYAVTVGRVSVTLSAEEIGSLVREAREAARSYEGARTRFRARLAERIAARAAERSRDTVLAATAEIVTAVRKTAEYQRLANRLWPRVAPERLVEGLYKNRRRLREVAGELLGGDEIELLLGLSAPQRTREMSATDIALLDEARWLIEPELRTFGHVVVDEAQNLTAMELRMVVRRARRQSLTILGDIAQRTTEAGLSSWDAVLTEAGVRAFAARDLLISYRVPDDFLRLAAELAGVTADVPEGVRHAQWPPVAVLAARPAIGETVVRLAAAMSEAVGSVAIVTPDRWLTEMRAALAALPFADATAGSLSAALNLLDLHVVKGLEFDAVIVVDPDAILAQRPGGGPGALYTALTRSTRALAIVAPEQRGGTLAGSGLLTVVDGARAEAEWMALRRDGAGV